MRRTTPPRSRSRSTASEAGARSGRRARPVTPLDIAARLLARAPRTEAELEARLVTLGYRAATAAVTVARCRDLGWVGDAAYARERACALRRRGAGSLRIAADLGGRGVAQDVVDAAVEASRDGAPEVEWARRALARVGGPRPRAWRALAGRGFPEDVIAELLGEP
jgi:regulatory protein